jgi:hypothetical protein
LRVLKLISGGYGADCGLGCQFSDAFAGWLHVAVPA